jgi:hypothetical protein
MWPIPAYRTAEFLHGAAIQLKMQRMTKIDPNASFETIKSFR